MNIPDGFLPLWQCVIYGLLMFIIWIFTLKWFVERLSIFEKEKPSNRRIISYIFLFLLLMIFAFILQAFYIPVPFGVGISLLGAALIAIILRSPWGAVLIMTPVLFIQWLFFGYGGLTTFGVDLLNIGFIAGFVGFYVYKLAKTLGKTARALIGGFFAGLLSLVVVSVAMALEMWLAGTFPLGTGLFSMIISSPLFAILEGIITMVGCVILMFIRSKKKKTESN